MILANDVSNVQIVALVSASRGRRNETAICEARATQSEHFRTAAASRVILPPRPNGFETSCQGSQSAFSNQWLDHYTSANLTDCWTTALPLLDFRYLRPFLLGVLSSILNCFRIFFYPHIYSRFIYLFPVPSYPFRSRSPYHLSRSCLVPIPHITILALSPTTRTLKICISAGSQGCSA